MIHKTAIVDPQAEIGPEVSIGAYAIIDGPVKSGAGTLGFVKRLPSIYFSSNPKSWRRLPREWI